MILIYFERFGGFSLCDAHAVVIIQMLTLLKILPVKSTALDVLKHMENLKNLKHKFDTGFSLVGELEDGLQGVMI